MSINQKWNDLARDDLRNFRLVYWSLGLFIFGCGFLTGWLIFGVLP